MAAFSFPCCPNEGALAVLRSINAHNYSLRGDDVVIAL
jgi:hypothetical protein